MHRSPTFTAFLPTAAVVIDGGEYAPTDHSQVLDIDVARLAAEIDWPPVESG